MAHRDHISRRTFLGYAGRAALAGAAVSMPRTARAGRVGTNDKVRLGIIGCGGMGRAHMYSLAYQEGCELVALCDCFRPRYEEVRPNIETITGKAPDVYQDFRHLLDRQDIDAVFVVTPDHWHPLMTILACEAGKDVFVEKPVCTTIEEGRAMVDAARRYGRVVQVGTQQRSMPVFAKAMDMLHGGRLGRITTATAWVGVNRWAPGETPQDPPEGLDWDLWLGPAPWAPYSPQRHGGWMGWHDYARGGQLTNWGIHLMDIVHWGIRQDRPLTVQALGANHSHGPGADNYETIEALFEYPGCIATWEQRHHGTHDIGGYGIEFSCERGRLSVDRGRVVVKPDHLDIPEYVGEPERSWANEIHHRNFFDCIRTRRRPVADIETGFRSTATVLLAGIALHANRTLHWDGDRERFLHDEQANRHLARAYRPPWRL